MRTYTQEHVEKLIALAFIKGQEFATAKMLKRVNISIGEQHDTQPESITDNTSYERAATNNFLHAFAG